MRRAITAGGHKSQAGLLHARETTQITVETGTYQITVEPGITPPQN
jgi:hypothetical protein